MKKRVKQTKISSDTIEWRERPTLKFLSAFSGAGGLDLGMRRAGFQLIGAIENDAEARKTVLANHPDVVFLEPHDINSLAASFVGKSIGLAPGELDVMVGGPPCQPFSKAAQWTKNGSRGLKDPRTKTLASFFTLVQKLLPKVVIIENVPGFVTGKQSALKTITRYFADINKAEKVNYEVDFRLVDAADYGVPQRRQRAVLIAVKDGSKFKWPEPTHKDKPICSYDAIWDIRVSTPPSAKGRWAGLLPSIPEGKNYLWHTPSEGGRPIFGYRTRFWNFLLKLSKTEPAWTLPASPGPATGPFHWDNRPLSILEMLRLQSFPKKWKVMGDVRAQVRQAGNATPPLLAEVIGRAVGTQFFGLRFSKKPTLSIPRAPFTPEPNAVLPVPKDFKRYEGRHEPHPGTGLGPNPRKKRRKSVDSTIK